MGEPDKDLNAGEGDIAYIAKRDGIFWELEIMAGKFLDGGAVAPRLLVAGVAGLVVMLVAPFAGTSHVSAQVGALSFLSAPQSFRSGWVELNNARARLVSGSQALARTLPNAGKDGLRLAGLHIKLKPKWKTYWRSPGASGVPPRFDWSGSKNVARVEVLWPAPARYVDKYATTVGYKDEVVLPLLITPKDPARPIDLKLKLFLGICEDICVPVDTALRLVLPAPDADATAQHSDALLAHFLRLVPQTIPTGSEIGPAHPLGVRSVRFDGTGKGEKLVVEAVFPEKARRRELYAEADAATYLPQPVVLPASGGDARVTRFAIDLSRSGGVRALKGKSLRLTLVSDQHRGEVRWRLE